MFPEVRPVPPFRPMVGADGVPAVQAGLGLADPLTPGRPVRYDATLQGDDTAGTEGHNRKAD